MKPPGPAAKRFSAGMDSGGCEKPRVDLQYGAMNDVKDRLNRLRRERKARDRTRSIQESWSEIDRQDGLTTREKLEQLINLRRTGTGTPKTKTAPPVTPVPDRERIRFTENAYSPDARYGRIRIADGLEIPGEILACLSRDPEFEQLDLSSALFVDLETTGLSGGTGTVPFNIGLGYYRDGRFVVGQYFLGELAAEEEMIADFGRFIEEGGFRSVVTYNGKAFDIPMLETRFILHRTPLRLSGLPHLDFLFPARNLWKHKHESCRLFHLAREVLQTGRDEDIPSAEIPWRYVEYLRTGDFELIEPILYHNAEDILSLLGMVIMGASLLQDGEPGERDAMDMFGAAKVLERGGETRKAADLYQAALDGALSEEVGLSARRRLASRFKRRQDWERAVELWRQMAESPDESRDVMYSLRELSMYYEHRRGDFAAAFKYAEEGYVVSLGFSESYQDDFTRRRERLKKKMRRSGG